MQCWGHNPRKFLVHSGRQRSVHPATSFPAMCSKVCIRSCSGCVYRSRGWGPGVHAGVSRLGELDIGLALQRTEVRAAQFLLQASQTRLQRQAHQTHSGHSQGRAQVRERRGMGQHEDGEIGDHQAPLMGPQGPSTLAASRSASNPPQPPQTAVPGAIYSSRAICFRFLMACSSGLVATAAGIDTLPVTASAERPSLTGPRPPQRFPFSLQCVPAWPLPAR
jgi:hypothetical protein